MARFRDQKSIVLGYLNVELDEAQNLRSQLVSDLLTEFGLINLMHHFRKRLRCHHLKTWNQVRQVTVSRAGCDYILGTNRRLF